MRIVASVVARASPADVWAWWTDYGEPGEKQRVSHGLASAMREVVSREGNRIVLRDALPGNVAAIEHDVVIHEDARRLEEHYVRGPGVPYRAVWRFEPEDGGRATRVTRVIDASTRVPGFLQELAAPAVRRGVEADMRAHVREMERDIGGA